MNRRSLDCSLYLVTEPCGDRGQFFQAVELALQNGVSLLQLREKNASSREFYQLALTMKEMTSRYRVPLLINDRLDIALAVDADGLHVGQEDLPVAVARRLLGAEKILGATAATVADALAAEKDGADYIGSGAVFPTSTKLGKKVLPLSVLRSIKQSVRIPVVAIGGINETNLPAVKEAGVDGVAVVSAIMGQPDPGAASRTLLAMWRK